MLSLVENLLRIVDVENLLNNESQLCNTFLNNTKKNIINQQTKKPYGTLENPQVLELGRLGKDAISRTYLATFSLFIKYRNKS